MIVWATALIVRDRLAVRCCRCLFHMGVRMSIVCQNVQWCSLKRVAPPSCERASCLPSCHAGCISSRCFGWWLIGWGNICDGISATGKPFSGRPPFWRSVVAYRGTGRSSNGICITEAGSTLSHMSGSHLYWLTVVIIMLETDDEESQRFVYIIPRDVLEERAKMAA